MENWKDLLAFNRSERRGIWILLVVIFALTGTNVFVATQSGKTDPVKMTRLMNESRKEFDRFRSARLPDDRHRDRIRQNKDSLFFFDPNTLDADGWVLLGLSVKQAAVITGYVKKGGRFRTREELKKSFVISERFYQKVEPWIRISPEGTITSPAGHPSFKTPQTLCINTADTAQLKRLRGIGTVLASRIVNYRESLGGFHAVEQLQEVYGLAPEVLLQNRDRVTISEANLNIMNINEIPEKVMASHPYISKKLAWVISTIRSESRILSREDLMQRLPSGISIPENLWPYLTF
ncbi:MAG: helix-hairpin-helix domain-containing protein [Bacteroidales bacterium]